MFWAQEHDERFPSPENIEKELAPYIDGWHPGRSISVLRGFTYTFPGADLEDVRDPCTTELGAVEGPGGAAILYGDGHVRWKSR
jgi:prepilin-type processing-associated H-X9-DG protein